jgi:hypothetical protein
VAGVTMHWARWGSPWKPPPSNSAGDTGVALAIRLRCGCLHSRVLKDAAVAAPAVAGSWLVGGGRDGQLAKPRRCRPPRVVSWTAVEGGGSE